MNIIRDFAGIAERRYLKKIISNISWLTCERLLGFAMSLLVGIWFARYLGPEKYGTFNYALSVVGLVAIFTSLGLNEIVIREIVKKPSDKYSFLGTAFWLMIIGSGFAYLLAFVAAFLLEPENTLVRILVAIMGLHLIFQAFNVIDLWYKSQINSRAVVMARIIAVVIFNSLKICLIMLKAPLIYFAWLTVLGTALIGLFMLIVYKLNREEILKWRFSGDKAVGMLKDSWPLIFVGLSASVYMKIDQVMIGNMLGDFAVGNYAVAIKITELWYFLPIILTSTIYPILVNLKKESPYFYKKRLQQLYFFMTWSAGAIAVAIVFLAAPLIEFLFGSQYSAASEVLVVYIWAAIPVFLSVATSSYLMTENLTKIVLYQSVICAVSNVILNWLLIPLVGLRGAAVASLISQSLLLLTLIMFKPTKEQFFMILKTLFIWKIPEQLRKFN